MVRDTVQRLEYTVMEGEVVSWEGGYKSEESPCEIWRLQDLFLE